MRLERCHAHAAAQRHWRSGSRTSSAASAHDRDGARPRAAVQRRARARARVSRSSPSAAPTARARPARCSKRSSRTRAIASGCYTSPHLLRYNERVRIGRREAADDDARARVRARRGGARRRSPLTYFEFGTLAAVWLFAQRERRRRGARSRPRRAARRGQRVRCRLRARHERRPRPPGLSRRHARGRSASRRRASSAPGRPAICADRDPPRALLDHAARHRRAAAADRPRLRLRAPRRGSGATGARAASATACRIRRCAAPISSPMPPRASRRSTRCASGCRSAASDVRTGCCTAENPGRFQVLPGRPAVVLDVAHNPRGRARARAQPRAHAARAAARSRCSRCSPTRTSRASSSAVKARDRRMARRAASTAPRGADAAHRARGTRARRRARRRFRRTTSVAAAYAQACDRAAQNDRIVVFGSFLHGSCGHGGARRVAARGERRMNPVRHRFGAPALTRHGETD